MCIRDRVQGNLLLFEPDRHLGPNTLASVSFFGAEGFRVVLRWHDSVEHKFQTDREEMATVGSTQWLQMQLPGVSSYLFRLVSMLVSRGLGVGIDCYTLTRAMVTSALDARGDGFVYNQGPGLQFRLPSWLDPCSCFTEHYRLHEHHGFLFLTGLFRQRDHEPLQVYFKCSDSRKPNATLESVLIMPVTPPGGFEFGALRHTVPKERVSLYQLVVGLWRERGWLIDCTTGGRSGPGDQGGSSPDAARLSTVACNL
eukprot:TRINITY_DN14510_c0_g1_i2.p1 TRINITY_DN14510_c0_g1~~TRINITY_DN14510_c0_g1_i2.p1  ORF type:complete len:255 (+),score=25.29 TRINITY_DN14510_c0_g1_i2:148-912(+)